MRKFDSHGLELAEFQGKIFEKSIDRYNCSSLVFLRRFKNSDYASVLDSASFNILLDVEYAFSEIDKQYQTNDYGNKKYSKDAMFWLGYIYRYISYTREICTKKAFNLIEPKELIEHYYVYHTQSEEWVISRILELKNKNEDFFDKNATIKKLLKEYYLTHKTC